MLHQLLAHIVKTPNQHRLNSFIRSASPELALRIFNGVIRLSAPHDHFTFTFAVKACCSLLRRTRAEAIAIGREIHAHALKSGHGDDIFIQNSLLSLYAGAGAVDSAVCIFSDISCPDVVSWTSLISGLSRNGRENEAIAAFSRMKVKPNTVTLVAVLSACSRRGSLRQGKSIHGYLLRTDHGRGNIVLGNVILDMYMRCGAAEIARCLFDEMPDRDVVSWTTMIHGYSQNGMPGEAIVVFLAMVREGEATPNEATFASVLGACAFMADLSMGKLVHSFLEPAGLRAEGVAGNALMNMYAKCGDPGSVLRVFDGIPSKDLAAWNTVLGAMAINGLGERAIEIFSLMIRHGVRPDEVSFLAVLSACRHAGLVDQGLLLLAAMNGASGIAPKQGHYGCVVDMLGRSGMLEESEDLAAKIMPAGMDDAVRGALLNACKIHGIEAKIFDQRFVVGEIAGSPEKMNLSGSKKIAGSTEKMNLSGSKKIAGSTEKMNLSGSKKIAGRSWLGSSSPPLETRFEFEF
ncbi:pentatricopeptide repeat-containing protein At2g29760, chloroplastic-like [Wolffia australiana]